MWPEMPALLLSVPAAFRGVHRQSDSSRAPCARWRQSARRVSLGGVALLQILRVPGELLVVTGWRPTAHMTGRADSATGPSSRRHRHGAGLNSPRDANTGLHLRRAARVGRRASPLPHADPSTEVDPMSHWISLRSGRTRRRARRSSRRSSRQKRPPLADMDEPLALLMSPRTRRSAEAPARRVHGVSVPTRGER